MWVGSLIQNKWPRRYFHGGTTSFYKIYMHQKNTTQGKYCVIPQTSMTQTCSMRRRVNNIRHIDSVLQIHHFTAQLGHYNL